jgi:hypothetical protein
MVNHSPHWKTADKGVGVRWGGLYFSPMIIFEGGVFLAFTATKEDILKLPESKRELAMA